LGNKNLSQGGSLYELLQRTTKFYCGIDLHARKMYLCILDDKGEVKLHKNMDTDREAFLKAIEPYREDVIVAVECMFTWYWIADLCQKESIAFVLGHALYMKAIHGHRGRWWHIDIQQTCSLQPEELLWKQHSQSKTPFGTLKFGGSNGRW
jgi:hypothetical protein